MIKVVIVDDEKINRDIIRRLLNDYFPEITVVAEADSVQSAMSEIKKFSPDLVFLDIEIKGGTGFDVLQLLKPYRFKVIFITAFDNFAVKAFKFSAVDYILKPVNDSEFQQSVQNTLKLIKTEGYNEKQNELLLEYYQKKTQQGKIVLRTTEALHIIDIFDIIYCKSDNAYTWFFLTTGEEIIVSKGIKEYVSLLEEYGFFRPHQSYLVNLNYVKKIDKGDGGFIVLKNGKEIPVSSRQKKKIIELFDRL
jgi:two-component system LytT family response regulator